MQSQIRFYITQNDDQAVVRTIPVLPPVLVEPVTSSEVVAVPSTTKPIERLKASKLVKSAAKLSGSGK